MVYIRICTSENNSDTHSLEEEGGRKGEIDAQHAAPPRKGPLNPNKLAIPPSIAALAFGAEHAAVVDWHPRARAALRAQLHAEAEAVTTRLTDTG